MDTFNNYEARILQNALTMNLNESKAPIEVKRIILEGLLYNITSQADRVVHQEEALLKSKKSEQEVKEDAKCD